VIASPVATPHPWRVLAGPPLDGRPEALVDHVARLGALPDAAHRPVIEMLEASGLLGRGGAGFPVGRKWRAMADRRAGGKAVVVANGAEGEPGSAKDRVLMEHRPHLVLDGALLAAAAVDADDVIIYVGREHEAAVRVMRRAIQERRPTAERPIRLVEAPIGYVAGEATAVVHHIDAGDARPTTTPPRMSERGVRGRPTLVQNVESLAQAALIARYGDHWYRAAGRERTRGTALVTVTGSVQRQGVREIELGTTLGEVVDQAGGLTASARAVLLGGYFGTWTSARGAWDLPLDPAAMREVGLTFGCGIVGVLPADRCGVAATAEIIRFLAAESAGQCGPCVFGLRAIADTMTRVEHGRAGEADVADVERWTAQLVGRGACRHPDGAVQLMASALETFGDDVLLHARSGRCEVGHLPGGVA
jgi:NADH:ubiquinone oxidoreductase subunit F (NADH-binding)